MVLIAARCCLKSTERSRGRMAVLVKHTASVSGEGNMGEQSPATGASLPYQASCRSGQKRPPQGDGVHGCPCTLLFLPVAQDRGLHKRSFDDWPEQG